MDVITLLLAYFISVNLIGFFLMGLDKYKAKKNLWRIPESAIDFSSLYIYPAPLGRNR